MRPTQKQNRSRGRGGRKPNGGNNINRVYESNGPEGKVRGTPQQIVEKYQSLARDAQTSGDRVVAENFLQHAEHYQRILLEAMGSRPDQQRGHPSDQDQPDIDDDDNDIDADSASMAVVEQRQPHENNGHDRREHRSEHRSEPRSEPRSEHRPEPRPERRAEVSGLTTIDAPEGDSGSLLVEAEDLGSSQPRRRRRSRQQSEGDATPVEVATETSSD